MSDSAILWTAAYQASLSFIISQSLLKLMAIELVMPFYPLPVNIQSWYLLELTGLVSLLSSGLSRVFSSTIVQRHQFFATLPSLQFSSHNCTWQLRRPQPWLYGPLFLLFNTLSVIAFLPRSNHLLISWLQSSSTVILEPDKRKSVTASTFSPSICHDLMGPDTVILVFFF